MRNDGLPSPSFGDSEFHPPAPLFNRQLAEQLPLAPLELLAASIASDDDELNSHGKNSLVAGVWCGGQKSG
jgi:hypothetical protein